MYNFLKHCYIIIYKRFCFRDFEAFLENANVLPMLFGNKIMNMLGLLSHSAKGQHILDVLIPEGGGGCY